MFRFVLAALLAASIMPVHAQSPAALQKRVEASMLVTGSLDIGTDGLVLSHALDQPEKIPEHVTELVARAAEGWRFVPVELDGRPVIARARMTLRMLARPLGDGDFEVSIANATFGDRDADKSDHVSSISMTPPAYPMDALKRRGQGIVYLVLKVDREGKVADAIVEQVNLRSIGDGREMQEIRKQFSRATLGTAKRWTFAPPTTGKHVDEPYWALRVPVEFTYEAPASEKKNYGKWLGYLPGPRQSAPWSKDEGSAGNDALAAGSLHQAGTGFRLLTPLLPES